MNKKDSSIIIAILLFISAGYLLFKAQHEAQFQNGHAGLLSSDSGLLSSNEYKNKSLSSLSQQGKTINQKKAELANENLKITSMKMELEKQRASIDNYKNAPKLSDVQEQTSIANLQQDNSLMGETDLSSMHQETEQQQYMEPKYEIMYQVYKKQQEAEYTEAYKAAYAKEFIENARKNGYEVILDSQYRIISAKKINKTVPGKSVFDYSSGNAR